MSTTKPKQSTELVENVKSVQLDLFSSFVANDKNDVSNTIRIWESIPKYFPVRTLAKLAPENGQPDPYEWEYIDEGSRYTVTIQPALIKEDTGFKAYFPSVTEELVEEVLKKILSDQRYGVHIPKNSETWVKFSLSMLYRELKARKCTRSRQEIKHAIQVMSRCNLTFQKNGQEIWSGSILQDLVTVGRKDYLEDTDSHHIARLPVFISNAINQLDYRQFNYDRFMNCSGQMTRWLYKKLIHDYRHASLTQTYHFMYSTLKRSGLLQQEVESRNRKKVIDALDELVKTGVLLSYKTDERKENRKIVDIKYTVTASHEFVKEQKAASKRLTDNENKALEIGLKQGK